MKKKVFFAIVSFSFIMSHNSMVAMYSQPYPNDEPDIERPKESTVEEEVSAVKTELKQLSRGQNFSQIKINDLERKIDRITRK